MTIICKKTLQNENFEKCHFISSDSFISIGKQLIKKWSISTTEVRVIREISANETVFFNKE
jgi:hypothetical protein